MNIARYMLASAERKPDALALADDAGKMTYGELREQAYALASTLIERGVQAGDVVAVLVERSCASVVAIHAALLCGAIYCPMDTKAPPVRIAAMLTRLGPAAILHNVPLPDLPDSFDKVAVDIGTAATMCASHMSAVIAKRLSSTTVADAAYVIFTSGSTGEPKGVTVSHGGVINYIEWARAFTRLGPDDRIAGQAPFHFDNSVLDIYLAMASGALFDIFPPHLFTFPRRLGDYLVERQITFIFWVPSALAGIASSGWFETAGALSLRHVVFAGEVMPPAALTRWMAAVPDARYSNLYGPTETTVDCTWYDVPSSYAGTPVPIGFPLPNTEILIVDEHNDECKQGEIGELLVRGAGVALGYWDRPDLTAAAFVQNPRHSRYVDRTYRTGDLGWQDAEGCIHFVGRRDNQIKRRGYRIELGDIEHALDGIPGLLASAVIFDATRDRLVVCAVSATDVTLTVIRKYLKDKVPAYMLPDALVSMPRLPLTSNGKIDRKTLLKTLDTPE